MADGLAYCGAARSSPTGRYLAGDLRGPQRPRDPKAHLPPTLRTVLISSNGHTKTGYCRMNPEGIRVTKKCGRTANEGAPASGPGNGCRHG